MMDGLLYVASSWRNPYYDDVLTFLHEENIPYYNFKNPAPGNPGFHWSKIDSKWQEWGSRDYRHALHHPLSSQGFRRDMDALMACTQLLLVLPCGRSAHLELGYAIGVGKKTIIYYPDTEQLEPELMYKAATYLCLTLSEILLCLRREIGDERKNDETKDHAVDNELYSL